MATSRQLARLEAINQSPIYIHFQETIYGQCVVTSYYIVAKLIVTGVSSIRAYRQQDRFKMESEHKVDAYQVAYYPGICANRCIP